MNIAFREAMHRQTGALCPACESPRTSYKDSFRYGLTLHHWGISISDAQRHSHIQDINDYVFHIHECARCLTNYCANSYKDFSGYIENLPFVYGHLKESYYGKAHPRVDAAYMAALARPETPYQERHRWILDVIRAEIGSLGGRRVLDLGAAFGSVGTMIGLDHPASAITFCETNPLSVQEIAHRYPQAAILPTTVDRVEGADAFDFIYCSDVIEHVWTPLDFARDIHRLLSPGGRALLVTPDVECPEAVARGPGWWGFIVPHHCQLFSFAGLASLLSRSGLAIAKYGKIGEELWILCEKTPQSVPVDIPRHG